MMRLSRVLLTLFLLLVASLASAQTVRSTTGTITANGQAVPLSSNSTGNGSFQITGTWSGTIAFETSNDNVTWVGLSVTPMPVSTVVTTTTGNGLWTYTGSFQNVRVRSTSWSSGTATIQLLATSANAGGGGGTPGPTGPGTTIGA